MKVRFLMTNGTVIEIDPPDEFNFSLCCLQVRSAGYFMVGNLYIDHTKINAMAFGDQQMDVKPAGATLQ